MGGSFMDATSRSSTSEYRKRDALGEMDSVCAMVGREQLSFKISAAQSSQLCADGAHPVDPEPVAGGMTGMFSMLPWAILEFGS